MKALIVDDERLARKELMKLLEEHPSIEIVGEAQNADEAEQMIIELNPDLLFLDIQMPGRTGFQLLESLDTVPLVVFTTAYDEFAIKAFEVSALDYLLKPVDPNRLVAALEKVRPRDSAAPFETGAGASRRLTLEDKVFVREGDHCWFVPVKNLRLLESEGNYTR